MAQARVVYIVDNDTSVRNGLSRLIRAGGFETRPFASPESFLEQVTAEPGSCVLLDIKMPDMTGPQVQARLKEQKIDIPVIAMSADDDAAARESAHRFGAQFFLSKPVDGHALFDTIAWVIEGRQARADGD